MVEEHLARWSRLLDGIQVRGVHAVLIGAGDGSGIQITGQHLVGRCAVVRDDGRDDILGYSSRIRGGAVRSPVVAVAPDVGVMIVRDCLCHLEHARPEGRLVCRRRVLQPGLAHDRYSRQVEKQERRGFRSCDRYGPGRRVGGGSCSCRCVHPAESGFVCCVGDEIDVVGDGLGSQSGSVVTGDAVANGEGRGSGCLFPFLGEPRLGYAGIGIRMEQIVVAQTRQLVRRRSGGHQRIQSAGVGHESQFEGAVRDGFTPTRTR